MVASYPIKLFLAMRCGNRCAMPSCRIALTEDGVTSKGAVIGEAAHIYGENNKAARYIKNMTDEQRNGEDNLLYLCPTCHTKIDKQEADYSPEKLIQIKKEHVNWVKEAIDESLSQIGFAELEIAANALASGKHTIISNFEVISPEQKIQKNNLSAEVRSLIAMGLSRSSEVSSYLSKAAELDEDFPERLSNGFKTKYAELAVKFKGDDLFYALFNFARKGQGDFKRQSAALAILCHLFHLCEVFER